MDSLGREKGGGGLPNPEIVGDDEDLSSLPDELTTYELVATKLADAGLSPEIISYAVDLPIAHVRTVIVRRRTGPVPLIDETLADGVRKLASAALREAHRILEFGPTPQKMVVIRSMLGGLSRHVTAGNSSEEQQARTEFEAFLLDMRTGGIPERERVVTDDSFLDVESTDASASAFAEPPDDQD